MAIDLAFKYQNIVGFNEARNRKEIPRARGETKETIKIDVTTASCQFNIKTMRLTC